MGRGRFNLIDSLFSLSAVYPSGSNNFELYYSFPTHFNDYMPVCNQRIGFVYTYSFSQISIGATVSYLAVNRFGGRGGNMGIADMHRISAGLNAMITLQ
jgi:hypothetical protein